MKEPCRFGFKCQMPCQFKSEVECPYYKQRRQLEIEKEKEEVVWT